MVHDPCLKGGGCFIGCEAAEVGARKEGVRGDVYRKCVDIVRVWVVKKSGDMLGVFVLSRKAGRVERGRA